MATTCYKRTGRGCGACDTCRARGYEPMTWNEFLAGALCVAIVAVIIVVTVMGIA